MQVAVVTRVIYAGAIEYSFSRRLATAVQAAVDLQGTLAQNIRQAPQVPAAVVVNNNSGSGAGSGAGQQQTPPTPPAAQLRDAIAARLSGLTGVTTGENGRAGVRTSFGIGTLGALSLTETFNRPIAVGAGSRLRLAFHQVLAGEEASKEIAEGPLSLQTQLTERFRAAEDYCLSHFQMRGRRDFDRIGLWSAMSGGDRTPPERPNLSGGTERALLLQTPPRPNSRVLRAP